MFLFDMVFSIVSLSNPHVNRVLQDKVLATVTHQLEQALGTSDFNQKRPGLSLLVKKKVLAIPVADLDPSNKALISRIIHEILCYVYWDTHCVFNDLPDVIGTLNAEELFRVFYLKALKQTNGWTCGYWALFNAYAVHSIILEGGELSNETISLKARKCFEEYPTIEGCIAFIKKKLTGCSKKLKQGDNTEMEHLRALARIEKKNGEPVFGLLSEVLLFTGINEDQGIYIDPAGDIVDSALGGVSLVDSSIDPLPLQELLAEHIRARFLDTYVIPNKRGVLPCICYLSTPTPHWIMIALIKVPDNFPSLLVLDSYNLVVDENKDAGKLIEFFYNAYIRPYELPKPLEKIILSQKG